MVYHAPHSFAEPLEHNLQMGCSAGDTECAPDEQSSHAVKIDKGFWMGQTLVTVAAWKRY